MEHAVSWIRKQAVCSRSVHHHTGQAQRASQDDPLFYDM